MVKEAIKKADVLIEALPYIKRFHKKIFVIKYGGSILGEERVRQGVLEDISFLRYSGIRPILVHGGGPNITERLKDHKVASEFFDGMRVTDDFTLKIVEEELGKLNDLIVKEIESNGVSAISFRRNDKALQAKKKEAKKDLGHVGDIIDFDKKKIEKALSKGIPVVSPMGVSSDGTAYNINADEVACFLAAKLGAEKLLLLTNVLGVMRDPSDEESLISTIKLHDAEEMIADKVIDAGMIPKVRAAVKATQDGVGKAHIVDAKIPHAILLEIFTDEGIGTEIIH